MQYKLSPGRLPLAACALLYVGAWFAVGLLPLPGTDLDQFFRPSADAMLRHPLLPYAVAGQAAYPNANGPLALVPLALLIGGQRALGLDPATHLARAVTLAAFSLFILLMAGEALRAVDTTRGRRVAGVPRLLAYGALTLAPTIFQGGAGYGHIEQPIETWLVLVAARLIREDRPARAGAALGLAVLARSPAVLFVVPLAVAAGRRRARDAMVLGAGAAAAALAGILPFLLADPRDVVHSLVTYRSGLLVGVGSIWTITRGTTLEAFAQHADLFFIAGAVVLSSAWLATRPGGLSDGRLYAALALSVASFALLAKTVWPYYLFEVYVFAVTWALGRAGQGRAWLTALAAGAVMAVAGMAEVGATPGVPLAVDRIEGVASFVLLIGMGFVVLRLA